MKSFTQILYIQFLTANLCPLCKYNTVRRENHGKIIGRIKRSSLREEIINENGSFKVYNFIITQDNATRGDANDMC